jgi:hypothetical protein
MTRLENSGVVWEIGPSPGGGGFVVSMPTSAYGFLLGQNLVPAGAAVVLVSTPVGQVVTGVVISIVVIEKLYKWWTRTHPSGKTPSQWADELTDPSEGWRSVSGDPDTWERDCPPGSKRTYEKVHRDDGIKYNEGLHFDYTDCDGNTWKDYPDGRRSPARP